MTAAVSSTSRRALLELPEVLEELGVSRSTFYEWRAKRKAPTCIKLPNGGLRVRRSALDLWLDAQEESSR